MADAIGQKAMFNSSLTIVQICAENATESWPVYTNLKANRQGVIHRYVKSSIDWGYKVIQKCLILILLLFSSVQLKKGIDLGTAYCAIVASTE